MEGCAVVVDDGADSLAIQVTAGLRERGARVTHIAAGELAAVSIALDENRATVEGESVGAVLFRARPDSNLAHGFAERDASFAANEARAVWLAVFALPDVLAINRFGPETWFTFAEWPMWRRHLEHGGVRVVELAVGDVVMSDDATWLPWGGGRAAAPPPAVRRAFGAALVREGVIQRSLVCCGDVLEGPDGPDVHAAAAALGTHGIELAEILTAGGGGVVSCSAHPAVSDEVAGEAATRIVERLGAHLHRR